MVSSPLIPTDAAPVKRTKAFHFIMNIESPTRVRHTYTQSLDGDAIWYRNTFMQEWESLMNAFLA